MKRTLAALTWLTLQKDLLLVIVFMLILLMMILPLPALLMDVLITLNISASILILMMSLHVRSPVQFSTFPSLLLVTTLFRLAISISTTRLILIEGDAGQIVETFGTVVVGGNLAVGLVIFLIITVVQFLVITKGADRVAEVGARFTLDGMPGKQMSVDADVRAGNIDKVDAKQARQMLEQETKLFGAMDGAMKFVKGDAIAGLVITAINLLGGIAIGMAQFGYGFGEALSLYGLMTIGDGLVAQIPALMISVAAGTIVTRVTNPNGMDLGTEIGAQITANHRTVIVAGVVIGAFGFVPGFPTLIFLVVGAGMVGGVVWSLRAVQRAEKSRFNSWPALYAMNERQCDDAERRTGLVSPVRLILPAAVRQLEPSLFLHLFHQLQDGLEAEFGIPMGHWRFDIDTAAEDQFKVMIRGDVMASARVRPDCVFVKANPSYLASLDIPHAAHFGIEEGALVSLDYVAKLDALDIRHWSMLEQVLMEVKRTIASNLAMFVGFQATTGLLDETAKSNPALVMDLRENLSNHQISAVLRLLVQERIPMTSRIRILESILEWAPKKPDPFVVLQHLRIAIGDFITRRFAPDGFLQVVILAPTLESYIREGFRTANDESYLILDSRISQSIAKQAKQIFRQSHKRGRDPVLLTQQDIRRAVHNVLHEHGLFIPVLAYQEITPQTIIYPVGFVLAEEPAALAA